MHRASAASEVYRLMLLLSLKFSEFMMIVPVAFLELRIASLETTIAIKAPKELSTVLVA